MTIVFKSDKSINYEPLVQISQGISMDFRQGNYAINGVKKELNDVLSVTTPLSRGFYDLAGSYNTAAAETAKLAISPFNSKRGLHKEAATNGNLLSEVALSLPEQYTKTLNSTGVSHYVLSMQGGGSIIVKDSFGVSHTVRQTQPAVIPTNPSNSSIVLDIQKKGSVNYVALHSNTRYNSPPVNRNTTTGVLTGDLISAKGIADSPKTLILSYSAKKYANAQAAVTNLWLFVVKGSDFNLKVGFKATTGQIIASLTKSGSSPTYLTPSDSNSSSGVFSIKITASAVNVYHSGVFLGSFNTSLAPVTALALSEISTDPDGLANQELNAYIHEVYLTPDVISDSELLGLSV